MQESVQEANKRTAEVKRAALKKQEQTRIEAEKKAEKKLEEARAEAKKDLEVQLEVAKKRQERDVQKVVLSGSYSWINLYQYEVINIKSWGF